MDLLVAIRRTDLFQRSVMTLFSLISTGLIAATGIVGQHGLGPSEIIQVGNHDSTSNSPGAVTDSSAEVQVVDDWRQFRGKNGTGIESAGSLLPNHLSTTENLRWKIPVAAGHSSPIVVGEAIIITGYEADRLITQCFDFRTGGLRWQKELPVAKIEKSYHHGPATPTAVSDGENVYCVFGSFGVIAYDLTGEEIWRKKLEAADNLYGTAASPILAGGRLIVFSSDQAKASLWAVNKTNGEVIWNRTADGPASSWATPAVWPPDDPELILIYEPFHLRAIAIENGDELWSIPGLADEPIAVPQVAGNLIIATSYNMRTNREVLGLPTFAVVLNECDANADGLINLEESEKNKSVLSRPDADGEGDHPLRIFFRMVDGNKNSQIEASEWPRLQEWVDSFQHANGFIALRIGDAKSAPELVWRAETGVPECPTSLIIGDRLFAVRNGGVVTCLDIADGKSLLRERVAPGGPYYASPVMGNEKIFLASARGALTVLSAKTPFNVLSTIELGEPIWATPALSTGALIVRSEHHLWLFENNLDPKGVRPSASR